MKRSESPRSVPVRRTPVRASDNLPAGPADHRNRRRL